MKRICWHLPTTVTAWEPLKGDKTCTDQVHVLSHENDGTQLIHCGTAGQCDTKGATVPSFCPTQ